MSAGAQRGFLDILAVEDNPGDAYMLREAFSRIGSKSRITVAQDGQEALDFLGTRNDSFGARRPDLILMDLKLPGKDGLEVLAEIKQQEKLQMIPVIIMTSSGAAEDISRAYRLCANCYIVKPPDFNSLVETVSLIEKFWLRVALP